MRNALLLLRNAKVYLVRVFATSAGLQLTRHTKNYTSPGTAFDPDVVHAHDLYTLLAGSRIAGKSCAHLIYDSHELEIGRNGNYGKWEKIFRANAERLLIGRTDHVITVCDSIADFLADRYKIERPIVVDNVPDTVTTTGCSDDIGADSVSPQQRLWPSILGVSRSTVVSKIALERLTISMAFTWPRSANAMLRLKLKF